jgi:hypothetical protein
VIPHWRPDDPDRQILLAGLTVRAAAMALFAVAVLLATPAPGQRLAATIVTAVVALEAAVVVAWWLRRDRVATAALWLDLPFGMALIIAGTALTTAGTGGDWSGFILSYTVLASLTVGFAHRGISAAALSGLLWGLASFGAAVIIAHKPPLAAAAFLLPSYLINPIVGATCGRLLRSSAAAFEAARDAELRHAAAVAEARERVRYGQALHDRILQTMETLARAGVIGDDGVRDRVRAQAAWLRRFVETAELEPDGFPERLTTVAREAEAAGTRVELNDAALLVHPAPLPPPLSDVVIDSARRLLAALGGPGVRIVMRVTVEPTSLMLTLLSRSADGALPETDIAVVRAAVLAAGGELDVEPLPYIQLRVPLTEAYRRLATNEWRRSADAHS